MVTHPVELSDAVIVQNCVLDCDPDHAADRIASTLAGAKNSAGWIVPAFIWANLSMAVRLP